MRKNTKLTPDHAYYVTPHSLNAHTHTLLNANAADLWSHRAVEAVHYRVQQLDVQLVTEVQKLHCLICKWRCCYGRSQGRLRGESSHDGRAPANKTSQQGQWCFYDCSNRASLKRVNGSIQRYTVISGDRLTLRSQRRRHLVQQQMQKCLCCVTFRGDPAIPRGAVKSCQLLVCLAALSESQNALFYW